MSLTPQKELLEQPVEFKVEQQRNHFIRENDDGDFVDFGVRTVVEVRKVEGEEDGFAEHLHRQQKHFARSPGQLDQTEILEPLAEKVDAVDFLLAEFREKEFLVLSQVEVLFAEEGVEHGEELEVVPNVHGPALEHFRQAQVLAERVCGYAAPHIGWPVGCKWCSSSGTAGGPRRK